jgi:hypothetical protein
VFQNRFGRHFDRLFSGNWLSSTWTLTTRFAAGSLLALCRARTITYTRVHTHTRTCICARFPDTRVWCVVLSKVHCRYKNEILFLGISSFEDYPLDAGNPFSGRLNEQECVNVMVWAALVGLCVLFLHASTCEGCANVGGDLAPAWASEHVDAQSR